MLKIENMKYEKADMRFVKDLRRQKFGRLTVLDNEPIRIKKQTYWNCKCMCGNEGYIYAGNLTTGKIRSCGCLLSEHRKELFKYAISSVKKYPDNSKRLYSIYRDMKFRCFNKNSNSYKYYGGKGVTICSEWLEDFMNFYNWAMSNGYEENLTIDRVDYNGNYTPNNCRWITQKQQMNNMSRNHLIEINGQVKTISEWADYYELPYWKMQNEFKKYKLI